jgi:hypothetical protein
MPETLRGYKVGLIWRLLLRKYYCDNQMSRAYLTSGRASGSKGGFSTVRVLSVNALAKHRR